MIDLDLSGLHPSNGDVLFISDLHLQPESPARTQLSLTFFQQAQRASALFIIGDLFEYWLGDDAADPRLREVTDALSALSAAKTQVHLMHGNRDFLLGETFAEKIGAQLHRADHVMVALQTMRVSLLHGDTLCTDDTGYQQLRKLVRSADWQNDFLGLSIDERIEKARQLRDKSRDATAEKKADIMDVNEQAVIHHCQQHPSDCLIHGHTHRPGEHAIAASSENSDGARRMVLGDWKDDHAMIARYDGTTLTLEKFSAT